MAEHSTAQDVQIVLISGVMASGKSTVAQLLAERHDKSVHIRGDLFRKWIVNGRAELTPHLTPEGSSQLLLRYRLATDAARTYAGAGFRVFYQDVILGDALTGVLAMLEPCRVALIVLNPSAQAVHEREAGRKKRGYGVGWTPEALMATLEGTPRRGLWLDSTQQTPLETALAIEAQLEAARV